MPDTFNDDWRYQPCEMWQLDLLHQQEVHMSGISKDEPTFSFDVFELCSEVLTTRQSGVVQRHLFDRDTLQSIATDQGCSRQRIYQVYHQALKKLAKALADKGITDGRG